MGDSGNAPTAPEGTVRVTNTQTPSVSRAPSQLEGKGDITQFPPSCSVLHGRRDPPNQHPGAQRPGKNGNTTLGGPHSSPGPPPAGAPPPPPSPAPSASRAAARRAEPAGGEGALPGEALVPIGWKSSPRPRRVASPQGGAPRGRGQPENTPKQSCPPRTAPQPPARPIQPSPHVAPRPGPAGRPARLTFLGRFHLLLGPAGALVHLHGGCGGHTCWRLCRHGHRAELPSPPGCGVCPRPGSQTGNGGSACGAWVGESEPGGRAGTASTLPSLPRSGPHRPGLQGHVPPEGRAAAACRESSSAGPLRELP